MEKITSRLTVYFENPYWVGVYEREWDGVLEVCKITFGAEPKDYQVYEYLLGGWHRLHFGISPSGGSEGACPKNPKRIQREITRQLADRGVGTKSQQALQRQREADKVARKARCRREREAEQDRKFQLRQEKKREKKKGH